VKLSVLRIALIINSVFNLKNQSKYSITQPGKRRRIIMDVYLIIGEYAPVNRH